MTSALFRRGRLSLNLRPRSANCSAISRLIVHRDVKDTLLDRIVSHLEHWPVGDPLDPESLSA